MQSPRNRNQSEAGPRRGRRGCDDETLDEAPQLLDELDDVEDANPPEENEEAEESPSGVFDEGPPRDDEPHE